MSEPRTHEDLLADAGIAVRLGMDGPQLVKAALWRGDALDTLWGLDLEVNTPGTDKLELAGNDCRDAEIDRLRAGGALPVHTRPRPPELLG